MTAGIWYLDAAECIRCGEIIESGDELCAHCKHIAVAYGLGMTDNPARLPDIGDKPTWGSSRLHPYPSWQVTYQHLYDARQRATCSCWDAGQVPRRFDIRGNWRVVSVFHIPGNGV
jgi:hypothetical protein